MLYTQEESWGQQAQNSGVGQLQATGTGQLEGLPKTASQLRSHEAQGGWKPAGLRPASVCSRVYPQPPHSTYSPLTVPTAPTAPQSSCIVILGATK